MGELTIKTNNVPRNLLRWYELTDKERAEFDYLDTEDKQMECEFVRYRAWVYDLGDVERIDDYARHEPKFRKWHGIVSDSFFSGVVFRYTADFEQVICGTYFS
ncbi:MAG TPA: hypothetical protein VGJ20_20350 [Xanthobacteraceae bacterium]|jgi:hypothetical protein